jgi:hypothetical protein
MKRKEGKTHLKKVAFACLSIKINTAKVLSLSASSFLLIISLFSSVMRFGKKIFFKIKSNARGASRGEALVENVAENSSFQWIFLFDLTFL